MTGKAGATKHSFLQYSLTIGLSVMLGRGFYYPSDTAVGEDGRLYTVNRSLDGDVRGVRVTIYNLDSEYFGTFASFGYGRGGLVWPTSIAIDSKGQFYISDEYHHRVTVYDSSGTFTEQWGVQGIKQGDLDGPSGMVFDLEDHLYVVDHYNNRVQKFSKDGRFLLSFGEKGTGHGQFNLPWGITLDSNGDLYVADWRNDRIQKFSPDGAFIAAYGMPGQGDGEFYRPASVAVDAEGYIYVADWGNERLQVLDAEGRFVMKSRGEATDSKWAEDFLNINLEEAAARAKSDLDSDLEFFNDDPHEESSHIEKYFWAPVSVKLDSSDRLYVTESNRHRVQIFQKA